MNVKKFFSKEQQHQILEAIKEAEQQTSGEVRLHLESKCKGDPLERAVKIFEKLKMHQTVLRNGALIYLAISDKKFAIFGDKGINEVVPENFWEDVKEEMRAEFVKGDFLNGTITGIRRVGEKLKEFFPYQDNDINELPDTISFNE
ncbi:MAG: TPM domain-containing protein [Calditrichaceae bacterium]|nr:TPM domain-containing protein [Calditrichaceae bacterium]MBN2707429.1 TPM domain-containing protein [Calditrichaceae bacterium]RQV93997.1 MAG: TPM domain-containing protein [Calditrichota bacterium]